MQNSPDPLVIGLRDPASGDAGLTGGKAAGLGELIRGGFPVPEGFVLTTAAYRIAVGPGRADPDDPQAAAAALRAAAVPPVVADALLHAYHALGSGPVAVRSSATGSGCSSVRERHPSSTSSASWPLRPANS
jgi:pyruvate,water dikinase